MIIQIPKSKFKGPFNLKLCMESDQCPTDLWEQEGGKFKTIIESNNKWISIKIWESNKTLFVETPKNVLKKILYHFWAEYDLLDFYSKFASDKYLSKVIKLLPGLRLMRSLDPNWSIFQAICTQNASISQIRNMERNLRELRGEGYTINPQILATISQKELEQKCKVGYRASYLINIAKLITKGKLSYEKIEASPTQKARKLLLKIKGIGPKVADIILLYTFGKPDTFPMDVWLKRALIREYFKGKEVTQQKLRDFALNYFGRHAGIAHLYMFYYERKIANAKN